jgi:hypothetical protein
MHTNLFQASTPVITFNTAVDADGVGNPIYMDDGGKLIDNNYTLEYGFYNKPIKINISKLFYIQKKYIGLGDIIDFFTKKLYIKDLIVYLTNGNCGCEARRVKFNKWFKIPYIKFVVRELYAKDLIKLENKKADNNKKNKSQPVLVDKKNNKILSKDNIIVGGSPNSLKRNSHSDSVYIKESHKPNNTTNTTNNVPVTPSRIGGGCGCRNKK